MSAPIRIPAPLAVGRFASAYTPKHVMDAVKLIDDAERELRRFRGPLLSVEDQGDRETALAAWHRADKVLAATALRPTEATGVLS